MDRYNDEDRVDHQSSAGLIIDNQGRILVQRHVKHKMLTLPIGKCKQHETPLQGLFTEMKEELGIGIQTAIETCSYRKVYDFTGKPVNIDTHIFRIYRYDGEIRNMEPEKCSGLLWMTKHELHTTNEKVADCLRVILDILD